MYIHYCIPLIHQQRQLQQTIKIMKTKVQFIMKPGIGGSLYRLDNGQKLDNSYLVFDCRGNYRVEQLLGFHAAPLKDGQIIELVTPISK